MTERTIAPAWPEPYLQPDPKRECTYYATAYLARCLGHPETTAQGVMDWRTETNKHEEAYLKNQPDVETRSWWADKDNDPERLKWWLGPEGREWVEGWLRDGWIGYARIHRVADMYHAVAVLDAEREGVLLMDPVYGHVIEPWSAFLGDGAGTTWCNSITTWHRPAPVVTPITETEES